jgi:hypothetical protein
MTRDRGSRARGAGARRRAELLAFLALSCAACISVDRMQLTSNVPGTVFRIREARLDAAPEAGWQPLGEGREIEAKVPGAQLEISAKPPGFVEKRVRLTEPVPRYEFKFFDADREGSPATALAPARAPEPAPAVPAFTDQRHALIVGISTYRDSDFQSLRNAQKDAKALAEFLQSPGGGGLSSSRVHVLVNEQATRSEIIAKLMRMAREANEGDLIILYFAGHARVEGGEKSARYLMPFDADPRNPWGTAIEDKELNARLGQANPKRQLLMLDCCYAGGPVVRGEVEDVWGGMQSPARVILTSTKGNETALDGDPRADKGPFMTQILRALSGELPADKNEDGRLTAQELYDAIGPQVRAEAAKAGHKMSPQLYGEWADKLELLRMP